MKSKRKLDFGKVKKFFKSPLNSLYFTQFLSAFADSAIILVISFMLKKTGASPSHIFLVESFFLFSYVFFACIVGPFADKNPKSRVLLIGNTIKAIGMILLFIGVSPELCYGVVGLGAAVYGPAKYGILKELTTSEGQLLNSNGKLESFTILAIIVGTLVGGFLSDVSVNVGTMFCLILYGVSIAMTFVIPKKPGNPKISYKKEIKEFFKSLKLVLSNKKMKYSITGTGSFWMISVVIKNGLLIWIPMTLGIQKGFGQSVIIGMTAIGIVIGALLAPKFASVKRFYEAQKFGYVVAFLSLTFPWIHNAFFASAVLLLIGIFAGLFVVPLNATIQEEGHEAFGVGKTIAVQNFVENLLMIIGTNVVYILNQNYGFSVSASLAFFGIVMFVLMVSLSIQSRYFKKWR